MRHPLLGFLALQTASAVLASPVPKATPYGEGRVAAAEESDLEQLAALAQSAFDKSRSEVESGAEVESGEIQQRGGKCAWENVRVRKVWGSLSRQEKLDYISAAKCLQSKPALIPASEAPGAKTRFDDFVAIHINRPDLQYWDWAKTAITGLEKSPIFDGSDTSMSGNGDFIPDRKDIIIKGQNDLPPIVLPVGTGGGCVTSGPFKDMAVNLGPAALDLPGGVSEANPEGPLSYNPRYLKRDLTTNVHDFQMQMQGVSGSGSIGIHGGGHYSLGGDPGRDVFVSPGDPVFYLHHSMIDRVWWMWQMLAPEERQYGEAALSGTNTFLDQPPSANITLDDYLEYGSVGRKALKIRDAMSTVAGPFCYVYL